MKNLTPIEISRINDLVGSDSILATATRAETHASPVEWRRGTSTPSVEALEHLHVIKEILELILQSHNRREAREWFLGASSGNNVDNTPYLMIRAKRFDQVRESARSFVNSNKRARR